MSLVPTSVTPTIPLRAPRAKRAIPRSFVFETLVEPAPLARMVAPGIGLAAPVARGGVDELRLARDEPRRGQRDRAPPDRDRDLGKHHADADERGVGVVGDVRVGLIGAHADGVRDSCRPSTPC
jgi:hypothetical protein